MQKIYIKINCNGKRTVRKANEGIKVEKNRFKNLKKREKRKWKKKEKSVWGEVGREWGRWGEENSTEPQRPNVEAEVYNNNRKCD